MELKNITESLVADYIERKYIENRKFYITDKAIKDLIEKYPENKKLEEILLKVSVINTLYRANILAIFEMAEHIKNLGIDLYVRKGFPEIIDKIATITVSGKRKRFYSFATKYCNWHNPKDYPVYDSIVENFLVAYNKVYKFSKFKRKGLRRYPVFKKVIEDFREGFKLKRFNFKQLDIFLWLYGKEIQSRNKIK